MQNLQLPALITWVFQHYTYRRITVETHLAFHSPCRFPITRYYVSTRSNNLCGLTRLSLVHVRRVLAAEQKTLGGLKVLNYAPGPMATDMSREIRSEETYEEEVRQGALIDPKVSAEKCVRLALCGRFATGAHVDFFDKEESG